MIIEKKITPYIVFEEDSILSVLGKISANKSGLVFIVNELGRLEGALTDGDFRRWLMEQKDINLEVPVSKAMKKDIIAMPLDSSPEDITATLSDKVKAVPIVDSFQRVIKIAFRKQNVLNIGGFIVDHESPAFIIAEIGNNHNGSLKAAKKLIDAAKDAGANCAKFQMRDMATLYQNAGKSNDASADLGAQYTMDLLDKFQLSDDELYEAFDYCKSKELVPLCTPWDMTSLNKLEKYGLPAYKVASADFTNHHFLKEIANTGKPMICSTGMSAEHEILNTVQLLKDIGGNFILLHCNSTYPTPFKDVNLNYIERLKSIGDCFVGYSGHERDIFIPVAAVAKGAKVIEKHFTLDKNQEGNDHKVSLLPDEFRRMVEGIRQLDSALGSGDERGLSQGELMNREVLAKSIIAAVPLKSGTVVSRNMLDIKSPGVGLQPNRIEDLIGKVIKRDMAAGEFFYQSDIESRAAGPRQYKFNRPWGIPVRYHDIQQMLKKINPNLVEIHLSYKDLELEFSEFINNKLDLDLVVHAPELFSGDHTLDLCAEDESYRERSVSEMQRVVDLTRELIPYFARATKPLIVTNVGGFSKDKHLGIEQTNDNYARLEDSLSHLTTENVEIIPQTMPPFPWHFGGQQFHNLFVDADSIVDFCRKNNMRVCLDVSHSRLACNHFGWSLTEFIKAVGPYVAHLHIADAKGVDGEGLNIGEGNIDWNLFSENINVYVPNASFIPEIWQGHKDGGAGAWYALEKLEKYFS